MGAPVLQTTNYGFPAQYASKVENLWPNQQGDNAYVTASAGDCLIAVAIGLKSYDPFDLFHGSSPVTPAGWAAGLNDFNAQPTITDGSSESSTISNIAETAGNVVTLTVSAGQWQAGDRVNLSGLTTGTWLNGQNLSLIAGTSSTSLVFNDPTMHGLQASHAETGTATELGGNVWTLGSSIKIADSDYTVSSVPPTAPNPYPSSKWSLDGYYPSIYIWVAENVQGGTYKVNLNSMYQPGITAPQDWSGGSVPIFDGGVNFGVTRFTGMTAVAADGSTTGISSANPAVGSPAIVTTGTGDLVFVVGLQKSANGLGLGTDATLTAPGYSRVFNGKLVGSEAHYLVQWGIQTAAGSYTPQFANPLGYETVLAAIALSHS
jgi:hypothetical protein